MRDDENVRAARFQAYSGLRMTNLIHLIGIGRFVNKNFRKERKKEYETPKAEKLGFDYSEGITASAGCGDICQEYTEDGCGCQKTDWQLGSSIS